MKLVSEGYPENEEYNTMLNVIGVSITMEYTTKMLYENTIGRVFSWFSNGTLSDEEKVIIEAQRAYSELIYDKAWYEFKFMPWVNKVWSVSNTAESNWLRKMERTLFFTMEFTFKAGYAKLIEWGAKSSYEEPVTDIYLLVSTADTLVTSPTIKVIREQGDKKIISIPRWGIFTKTIQEIAGEKLHIMEIGGNDEIIVSILAGKDQQTSFSSGELLYESRVVTKPEHLRLVYLLKVEKLLPFIREARQKDVEVEHVFDY
jgi:hypothetical protein